MSYFKKTRLKELFGVTLFVSLFVVSSIVLKIDWILVVTNFSNAINYFISDYFPLDFSELKLQLLGLVDTIFLAVTGTGIGMIFAFLTALMISVSTSKNKIIQTLFRFIASVFRNVPEGVWAVVLLLSFWFGKFLALLVMIIVSYGFLSRVFAETIDETNSSSIEALEATGASFWQIVIHSIIPETLPSLVSWTLYSIENNIRSATVIGMFAGGGIGHLIGIYKGQMNYPLLLTAALLVTVLVILTDKLSGIIRRRILS